MQRYREACVKYTPEESLLAEAVLFEIIRSNPSFTLQQFVNALNSVSNKTFSRTYVQDIFTKWRWSWRRPGSYILLQD